MYVIIGAVALIGALAAAFVILNLVSALDIINSNPDQLPPGTDAAALQESVQSLNAIITAGSAWVVSVILAGLLCIHTGIGKLRTKKIKPMGR